MLERRTVLAGTAVTLGSLAGCTGLLSESASGGPYSMTITGSTTEPEATVEPTSDADDVMQVSVDSEVTIEIINETDGDLVVHNHATDEEYSVEQGERKTVTFTPSEAGRYELEVGPAGHDDHGHGDEGGEQTEDGHGDHTEDGHGDEGSDGDHEHGATAVAYLEVRP